MRTCATELRTLAIVSRPDPRDPATCRHTVWFRDLAGGAEIAAVFDGVSAANAARYCSHYGQPTAVLHPLPGVGVYVLGDTADLDTLRADVLAYGNPNSTTAEAFSAAVLDLTGNPNDTAAGG